MYVLFDENGREYLRYFVEPSEEIKKLGVFVDEKNIPEKDNCMTVIYKKTDGTIKFEFEGIKPDETTELRNKVNELQKVIDTMIMEG